MGTSSKSDWRRAAESRKQAEEGRKKVYRLASKCQVCKGMILPGQTWKFTPEGGKVHYYCAKANPEWGPESGEPWPGLLGRGRFGIVNTLTHLRVPYRFEARQEAQDWIDGYGVNPEYKSNFKIVEDRENPAGPTFPQAMTAARAAGARIGDTSGFEPWLVKAKLNTRSPQILSKLKAEFWKGVETGEGPMREEVPGYRDEIAYHGARIWRTAEGWKTNLDPESLFDSLKEAKRFVEGQRRNPKRRRRTAPEIKLGPDYTVTVAGRAYYFKTLIEALRFWRQFRGAASGVGFYRGDEPLEMNPRRPRSRGRLI